MDDTRRYERLLDRYRHGDVSRRTFLGLIGAAAGAYGLAGGPFARMAQAQAPSQIRFDGWGGIVSQAFRERAFDPYTAATGITVVDGTFTGADEYLAMVRASGGGEYNLAHLSGVFDYARYHNLGLTSVLNEGNIPNLANIIPALDRIFRDITGGTLSAVPYNYGTTGLAYNRAHISDEEIREKGASILIDSAYRGKIGGWSEWKTRIWYGALQTGQDPNAIQDIDAIWDAIRANRDLVLKYWSSGAELMSLLAEEEIYVTEAWSGRVQALQDQGHDIGYYDPPDGMAWEECIFVIKDSPMEACEELLNFMLEPEVAIAVAEGQFYPPALDPTKVELTDKIRALPAFDPTGTLSGLKFFEPDAWNSNEVEWSRTYARVERGF